MGEKIYTIDTRQKYFHVPVNFLQERRPPIVQVYHPSYRTNDKGISQTLVDNGYIMTTVTPIMDEYRLPSEMIVEKQMPNIVLQEIRENYKKDHPPIKNPFKSIASGYENMVGWIKFIFWFVVIVIILLIMAKLLPLFVLLFRSMFGSSKSSQPQQPPGGVVAMPPQQPPGGVVAMPPPQPPGGVVAMPPPPPPGY